jgi:hypothetical protein
MNAWLNWLQEARQVIVTQDCRLHASHTAPRRSRAVKCVLNIWPTVRGLWDITDLETLRG